MRKIITKEDTAPGGFLKFCYHTWAGGVLLKLLTARWLSKTAGFLLDRGVSKCLVKGFIKRNGIDMSRFEEGPFKSFNSFFTRHLLPDHFNVDEAEDSFVSPADGKISVYRIEKNGKFEIKGYSYTVETLLQDVSLADKYMGGLCIVVRLAVDDYHRYIYVDDCSHEGEKFIKGRLHTVQPVALGARRVFTENCRSVTVLHTKNFGDVAQIEVGAMMVGRIVNNHESGSFARGDEKGRFEFGGSTIVLLVEKDKIVLDPEFYENSENESETVVRCGEKIGEKIS
ncbi:MAG: phosphatidylserine decarboxylase [Ruminococcaceae bacterium]|nr:phosphatidylserine decarboxylase [Oscillospiraceae bacterium]